VVPCYGGMGYGVMGLGYGVIGMGYGVMGMGYGVMVGPQIRSASCCNIINYY
jgi:hypothetical protein